MPKPDEPTAERQNIIIASWHSQAIEVAKGERTDPDGPTPNAGIGIAATQLGDDGPVVLMLSLADGAGESMAGVLSLDEWNRFCASIQLAMMDAAKLETERLRRAGHEPPCRA